MFGWLHNGAWHNFSTYLLVFVDSVHYAQFKGTYALGCRRELGQVGVVVEHIDECVVFQSEQQVCSIGQTVVCPSRECGIS